MEVHVVSRPAGSNAFEFAVVSALRAAQLMKGCVPRVDLVAYKHTTTAQLEVAAGKVARVTEPPAGDGSTPSLISKDDRT